MLDLFIWIRELRIFTYFARRKEKAERTKQMRGFDWAAGRLLEGDSVVFMETVAEVRSMFQDDAFYDGVEEALSRWKKISLSYSFQVRVREWVEACFGKPVADDKVERNHRFLEEALELVQSTGCTKEDVLRLVEYVYNRPIGYMDQEVGGVMTTLAALCAAQMTSMGQCGEDELQRIWNNIEKIRAKQAAKPKNSPLPQRVPDAGIVDY